MAGLSPPLAKERRPSCSPGRMAICSLVAEPECAIADVRGDAIFPRKRGALPWIAGPNRSGQEDGEQHEVATAAIPTVKATMITNTPNQIAAL